MSAIRTMMPRSRLRVERLESRDVPAIAALVGNTIVVTGTPVQDRIDVGFDAAAQQYVVRSFGVEVSRFDAAAVANIDVDSGDGDDVVKVARDVTIPVRVFGGAGRDKIAGHSGIQELIGGDGPDLIKTGAGPATIDAGVAKDKVYDVKPTDTLNAGPQAIVAAVGQFAPAASAALAAQQQITEQDIKDLLQRAAAVSSSNDAIIAVVDQNGNILGVRVEAGVAVEIQSNPDFLAFAIDGAVSKARTAAFFSSNAAPLTTRTIQFISQSTITEREVNAYPFINDPNSTLRGPGYVAPVGTGGHFPPNVNNTPQVDLYQIEHTNRDSILSAGADHLRGTADDVLLAQRFNINSLYVPAGKEMTAPEAYGFAFGSATAQNRGIATLPGGVPLFKNGVLVGGIGVFFPGKTGFASEENSSLSTTYDPSKADRTLEAEFMAFQAAGGAPGIGFDPKIYSGIPPVEGYFLPLTETNQRIDLVGVTLDIIGPGGLQGPENLTLYGQGLNPGDPFSGVNVPVAPGMPFGVWQPAPDGWLVVPHDGVGISAQQVREAIEQGIAQAEKTRAAIRLPLDQRTRMVFAITDSTGEVLGLFRMPDATIFSIDVAVAKARNVAYYNDANKLQPIDQIPGVPAGTAFTARTFRYVSEPRFPEGINGKAPGPFSNLNDGGSDFNTAQQVGPRLPASAFQSVVGYDSFNPGTNFRDPANPLNQNGVVFFPGSSGVYINGVLVGGLGVSGDGVDQDDVVTAFAAADIKVPTNVTRADEVFVRGIRLPYQKFNRNPED